MSVDTEEPTSFWRFYIFRNMCSLSLGASPRHHRNNQDRNLFGAEGAGKGSRTRILADKVMVFLQLSLTSAATRKAKLALFHPSVCKNTPQAFLLLLRCTLSLQRSPQQGEAEAAPSYPPWAPPCRGRSPATPYSHSPPITLTEAPADLCTAVCNLWGSVISCDDQNLYQLKGVRLSELFSPSPNC